MLLDLLIIGSGDRMMFRQRYYFERERENPAVRYTSGGDASVSGWPKDKPARYLLAARAPSLTAGQHGIDPKT